MQTQDPSSAITPMQTGGADPAGCATATDVQACTSSTLFVNGHKSGDPSTTGRDLHEQRLASAHRISRPGSSPGTRTTCGPGQARPNISGTPTFVGGAHPTTWAGFELTSGSTGHDGGSDGQDVGIRSSAGGPPTGGGSAPTNTTVPSLTGTATQGNTLTTTKGTWTITGNVPTVNHLPVVRLPNLHLLRGVMHANPATDRPH